MSTRNAKDLNFLAFFDIIHPWTRTSGKERQMVLIISSSKKTAEVISDMFHYMGVISCAATPTEALSEFSGLYRAALVINPCLLPDHEDFVKKLRSYASAVPIFAITEGTCHKESIFDGTFKDSIYSSTLLEEIIRYQSERGLPLCAHYRVAGIDASCTKERVTYFDKPIAFTKTETMIMRYLIAAYPTPQSAKRIVKYAYKPTKKPEISSIRTHLSVMNKKFKEATGKNLCLAIEKEGYVIATPMVLKELSTTCV